MKKSNKRDAKFVAAYNQLDVDCCAKFGIAEGGVAEYLDRLNNLRYAPDREELIAKLSAAQNYAENGGAKKADMKWVEKFDNSVVKKKDSLSAYLKKAKKYARRQKAKKRLGFLLFVVCVLALAAAFYVANVAFDLKLIPDFFNLASKLA